SSGHLRHFGEQSGAADLVLGIPVREVTDQSVTNLVLSRLGVNTTSGSLLVRRFRRFLPAVMRVRHHHDRRQQQEQRDRAQDKSGERRAQVRLLLRRHYFAPGSLETLAFVTVSFWAILGTTSIPSITLPKTVWTPFKCLVFC